MDIKKYVEGRTTEQLTDELSGLNISIEEVGCNSLEDLVLRDEIELELSKRGLTPYEDS